MPPIQVMPGPEPRSVVIIGGGLAGALTVRQLLLQTSEPLAITVLEPRERLWAGVAYSSADACHITNVPAARMSIDPNDSAGFIRWLGQHGDDHAGKNSDRSHPEPARRAEPKDGRHLPCFDTPAARAAQHEEYRRSEASSHPASAEHEAYPRRWLFGDYVREQLRDAAAARPDVRIRHLRQHACDAWRTASGFAVRTHEGGSIEADALVLATGNPAPTLPGPLQAIAEAPACIRNPWIPQALAGIAADARVLIVGTGLTMGDTVASLRAAGHRGAIVALSRRGQSSRRGMVDSGEPFGDFRSPPRTALALLHLFRTHLRHATASGRPWQAVLAAARAEGWRLWQALPMVERRRFARHLRLFWEVHRHVMPGPVHDMLLKECREGSLRIVAGRLRQAEQTGSAIDVVLQPRGASEALRCERFDAVVNCTGPAYAALCTDEPLWASLTRRGLVRADPTGLGPESDCHGRAIGVDGEPQPDLILAGTLARSAFGELTGVREIALETRLAAETLVGAWAKQIRGNAPGGTASSVLAGQD